MSLFRELDRCVLSSVHGCLASPSPKEKPDKKQRRELLSLKHGFAEAEQDFYEEDDEEYEYDGS